jgi:hypothetical protein
MKFNKWTAGTVVLLSIIILYTLIQINSPPISSTLQNSIFSANAPNSPIQSNDSWIYIVLVIMAATTTASTGISFYLYRWRKILLGSPELLLPEQLGAHLQSLSKQISVNSQEVSATRISTHENAKGLSERMSNLIETFLTLQTSLDEKDKEIRKLKNGFEQELFRKFLIRFIRVDQAIGDIIDNDVEEDSELGQIKTLLEDALAECGVERFEPKIGENYSSSWGVADNPKLAPSDNAEDHHRIESIVDCGYLLATPKGHEAIVKAKVKIHNFIEKGVS